jgi:transcriptional regulator with XRE-family HTH domain
MSSSAILLSRTRAKAGLSVRELARRAAVPPSTVSRIETGAMDPTVSMLERVLAAAGERLSTASSQFRFTPSISELTDVVEWRGQDRVIDWTRLRGFIDWLDLHPDTIAAAIATPPPRTGDERLDNLLAATAETVADEGGIPNPRWCSAIPPLSEPWCSPGTPRMIASAAQGAARPFANRNIWIDRRDLWRHVA